MGNSIDIIWVLYCVYDSKSGNFLTHFHSKAKKRKLHLNYISACRKSYFPLDLTYWPIGIQYINCTYISWKIVQPKSNQFKNVTLLVLLKASL